MNELLSLEEQASIEEVQMLDDWTRYIDETWPTEQQMIDWQIHNDHADNNECE